MIELVCKESIRILRFNILCARRISGSRELKSWLKNRRKEIHKKALQKQAGRVTIFVVRYMLIWQVLAI